MIIRSLALATLLILGAAGLAHAETRVAALGDQAEKPVDPLRASYLRPTHIPFPASNPYTPKKAALGKLLYFDPRLSKSNIMSCASCHNPGFGYGDGLSKGVGDEMKTLGRKTPTILNAAWGQVFFWDGRAATLEEQALGPVQSEVEMNMPLDVLLEKLNGIPGYVSLFEEAFPGEGITLDNIAKAIATFERTVVSSRAPFDRWVEGDERAISDSAKRGFTVFNGKARCAECHGGWNFTDDSFHDIGLPDEDQGRGAIVKNDPKMKQAFKTPSLRDLSRRAPYMHDGSMLTIEEVVAHYESGGVQRPSLSDEMKPLSLSDTERADLLAFLDTLTGGLAPVVLPVLPR